MYPRSPSRLFLNGFSVKTFVLVGGYDQKNPGDYSINLSLTCRAYPSHIIQIQLPNSKKIEDTKYIPGKPVAVNFHLETPKTSHSCLKKWYTRFSR